MAVPPYRPSLGFVAAAIGSYSALTGCVLWMLLSRDTEPMAALTPWLQALTLALVVVVMLHHEYGSHRLCWSTWGGISFGWVTKTRPGMSSGLPVTAQHVGRNFLGISVTHSAPLTLRGYYWRGEHPESQTVLEVWSMWGLCFRRIRASTNKIERPLVTHHYLIRLKRS